MLTPMNRAGGLPANVDLRMAEEGRFVARRDSGDGIRGILDETSR
jgi:hypothetical protein